MSKLSTRRYAHKTNPQGNNWRVQFPMRTGMGRYLTEFGLR